MMMVMMQMLMSTTSPVVSLGHIATVFQVFTLRSRGCCYYWRLCEGCEGGEGVVGRL